MTLLASERSLLIRSKFRSVLQLRIQNRRQNEINADSALKSTFPSQKAEKEQSGALRLTDDAATQKSPPGGRKTETAQATDRSVCAAQRQKKARHTEPPSARFQRRPGSLEPAHTHTPAPDHCSVVSFPLSSDVFEGDISSCSSSSSSGLLLPLRQSPAFSSSSPSRGLPGDQLLSDLSPAGPPLHHHHHSPQSALVLLPATEGGQPMSMALGEATSTATTGRPGGMYVTSSPATPLLPKTARPPGSPSASAALIPSLASARPPRPRKPRETKPKMRKLKYHQYIPPDQRVSPTTAVASKKSPTAAQPIVDPAYSHLLQKQQVFLQLQILQNQQQHQQQQQQQQQHQQPTQQQQPTNAVPSGGEANQMVRFSGAQPVGARTNHTPADESTGTPKPELLPANLVDLTVSELRQQLRKRGLPVSGTKPALLQRLRPFQLPHTCLTPTPLCQLEPLLPSPSAPQTPHQTTAPSLLLLPPPPPLTPIMSHSPSGSSAYSSAPDSPDASSPGQRLYIQPSGGIPNGVLYGGVPGGLPHVSPSKAVSVSVAGEQCVFLAPSAGTPSGTPSPSLPLSSSSSPCSASSPLQQCGAPWRTDLEQQMELSLEEAMRERRRNRPRDRAFSTVTESCVGALHPFLQQDPGRVRVKTEPVDEQTEVLFTQVFCCQPCDPIGQDFELPVQITASPVQTPPTPCSVRSLEEELQEAIQKAQMGPSQSLEDILDDWMPLPSYSVALLDSAAHINDVPQHASAQSQQPSRQQSDQSQQPSQQQSDRSQPSSQQSDQSQRPSLQLQQQSDQSQPISALPQQQQPGIGNKEDNFLSSPLCSSLLLEMPPSPVVTSAPPLPPPPPPCASPLSSPSARGGGARKRRAAVAFFDPSEWLETLACGLRPLSPAPASGQPFLDDLESDLNVNRVLDMLIEQW